MVNTHKKKRALIPNLLTSLRLILAPLIAFLIFQQHAFLAFFLFLLALLTDLLDGFLARRFHWETPLGRHLDRWADKILFGCTLVALLIVHQLTFWLIIAALATLALLWGYASSARKVQVTLLGRVILVLEAALLAAMILGYINNFMVGLFFILLAIPAADYLRTAFLVGKEKGLYSKRFSLSSKKQ